MVVHRQHLEQTSDQRRKRDAQMTSQINDMKSRIEQQWTDVEARLKQIIQPSKELIDTWRLFDSAYIHLLDRLGELDTRNDMIQREKFTGDLDSLLTKAKVRRRDPLVSSSSLNFTSELRRTPGTTASGSEPAPRARPTFTTSPASPCVEEDRRSIDHHSETVRRTQSRSRRTSRLLRRIQASRKDLLDVSQRIGRDHQTRATSTSSRTAQR